MLWPRVVIVRLERKHFSFIPDLSGVLWFFFVLFFPTWIFLKAAHHPVVTAEVRQEQKGHGCDTPLKLCGSSACSYFHSVGLFSHNTDAAQTRKCQNVFSTCVGERRQDGSEEVCREVGSRHTGEGERYRPVFTRCVNALMSYSEYKPTRGEALWDIISL